MALMSIYYFVGLIVFNLCVILCLLSKYHYGQMSLLQRLVSAILYAGHSGTMVSFV